MEFLDFAIDSLEHTMLLRAIISYGIIIIIALVIIKLFISIIHQIKNLFK